MVTSRLIKPASLITGRGFEAAIDRERCLERGVHTPRSSRQPRYTKHCRSLCSKRAHIIGRCDAACIHPRLPGPRENLYFPGRKIDAVAGRVNLSLARGNPDTGAAAERRPHVHLSLSPRKRERETDLNLQEISLSPCTKINDQPKVIFYFVRDAH